MENRFRSLRGFTVFAVISLIGSVFSGGLEAQDARTLKIRALPDPGQYVDAKIIDEMKLNVVEKNRKIDHAATLTRITGNQMDAMVGKYAVVEEVVTDVYPLNGKGWIFSLGSGRQALIWAEDIMDYVASVKKYAAIDMSQGLGKGLLGWKGKKFPFAGKIKTVAVKKGRNAGKTFTQVVVDMPKVERFIIAERVSAQRLAHPVNKQ